MDIPSSLIQAADELSRSLGELSVPATFPWVYNPLVYARDPYGAYVRRFAAGERRVLFLGMNPGPWGMAQTGVPFGEVRSVQHWMGITGKVGKPEQEHPKRPVEGFACRRSEVSGRRLWGFMERHYPVSDDFFREHFVANYCPLLFFDESGKNITPDKLPAVFQNSLDELCMHHLIQVIRLLQPLWLVGIGVYAAEKLKDAAKDIQGNFKVGKILHPSPASPRANRGWEEQAEQELTAQGVWGRAVPS